jgi:hypothetical protein
MTTHGEKVCQFIERYFLIPEGSKDGQPINVLDFQSKFVLDVYNNPACTSLAWYNDRVHDYIIGRPRQNDRRRCRADYDVWIAIGTGYCLFWLLRAGLLKNKVKLL